MPHNKHTAPLTLNTVCSTKVRSTSSKIYRKSIEHLPKIYRTSIENLSNIYRKSIENLSTHPPPILLQSFSTPLSSAPMLLQCSSSAPALLPCSCNPSPTTENLSKIYWKSKEILSNIYRKSIEIYRKSIEHLSNIYRKSSENLSNIFRKSIENFEIEPDGM